MEEVRVRGELPAYRSDRHGLNILGRDVLDHFDLVLVGRRSEIFLLAPSPQYRIERT